MSFVTVGGEQFVKPLADLTVGGEDGFVGQVDVRGLPGVFVVHFRDLRPVGGHEIPGDSVPARHRVIDEIGEFPHPVIGNGFPSGFLKGVGGRLLCPSERRAVKLRDIFPFCHPLRQKLCFADALFGQSVKLVIGSAVPDQYDFHV